MATDTNRRLTPIIIRSRHFSASEPSSSEENANARSKRNHVEFCNRIDQAANARRRSSFFQHYLRRFSGSGGGNLLSVARLKPPSQPPPPCRSPSAPGSSTGFVVDLQSQSALQEYDENGDTGSKRIGDRRLQAPRLSLLGRPIMYRPPRTRNKIYHKIYHLYQIRFYNFLERPSGCLAFFYHLAL